jgi:hypothetical protein
MAFREVSVVQVREALRRWLKGDGERPIAAGVGVDRKTVRRYITAAVELGVDRRGGEEQLTDALIGQVVERVRPHRSDGHGESWRTLLGEEERIKEWVKKDLTVVKIGVLLARRGVVVPHRTLARFARGHGRPDARPVHRRPAQERRMGARHRRRVLPPTREAVARDARRRPDTSASTSPRLTHRPVAENITSGRVNVGATWSHASGNAVVP